MEEKNSDIQPIKKRKISTSALDPIGQFLGDFEINSSNETTISQFELEINQYLMDSHIARDSDPLVYWRNKTLWPNLQQMAKIYLAAPPSSVESERVFSTLGSIFKEINQYLMDSHIARDSDPLVYWRNKTLWPNLQQMAKIYLAAPPSSVESERVFSTLGGIYKPKRTSLKEENAKKQLFLHHHL
uniref:HAT C-terminal dimerisation domain-containing protein n=1 Tax=Meloidogyne incognita TaxID=6306 RepID=A0A914L1R5_MELIC